MPADGLFVLFLYFQTVLFFCLKFSAIEWHTTGKPDMTLLEKIVFTADYIEPGRDQAPNLAWLRQLAFTDIDQAVCEILKQTLDYLRDQGGEIDPATEVTYSYYLQKCAEAENAE